MSAGLAHSRGTGALARMRVEGYVRSGRVLAAALAALIVLDEDNLVQWAQETRVPFGSYPELAKSPAVHKLVAAEVRKANDSLTHVEAVKKFRILERRLDRDEGELTPTLKVRRKIIEQKYAPFIEEMYGD